MFTSLTRILVKSANDLENRFWIPLMEQAINVIYKLAEVPDNICGELIKKLALESGKVLADCEKGDHSEKQREDKPAEPDGEKSGEEKGDMETEEDSNPMDLLG